jgi:hypothetical protein
VLKSMAAEVNGIVVKALTIYISHKYEIVDVCYSGVLASREGEERRDGRRSRLPTGHLRAKQSAHSMELSERPPPDGPPPSMAEARPTSPWAP